MDRNPRLETVINILRTVFGLFIFSIGDYITIVGNIGLTPWDSFTMGISSHVGLSFGQVHLITAVIIIGVDLLLKEKIGFGTILDALLVGPFVDLWTALLHFTTAGSVFSGIALMIVGLPIMAAGQVFYMSGGLSCGPRDTLLIAVGKRLPKMEIGMVDILMKVILVLISWLIGGPIGIGTLLAMVGMGTAMRFVFRLFNFEPRYVIHEGVVESMQKLVSPKKKNGR